MMFIVIIQTYFMYELRENKHEDKDAMFIIKGFWTIVFIFIVILTTFRPIYLPAFFRCLSNFGTYKEFRTSSFNPRGSPALILSAITGYKY